MVSEQRTFAALSRDVSAHVARARLGNLIGGETSVRGFLVASPGGVWQGEAAAGARVADSLRTGERSAGVRTGQRVVTDGSVIRCRRG